MTYTVPHFIAGKSLHQPNSNAHSIYNPTHGEIIGQTYFADQELCEKAVSAAKKAWDSWSQTPTSKRVQVLFKFRTLLETHQLALAKLVSQEHGKTRDDALGSIMRAKEVVEFHCNLITQLQGTFSANVSNQVDCYTIRQPLGVCAGVSPFNFPVMVPIWMMIPAIACGNTFILKPSEQNPSVPVRLMELLQESGLPDGVVNCLQGDKSTVETLLKHPEIASFTAVASTPVAKAIYTEATATGKRAHTFGGAKNHAVVLPDADMTYTAKAILGAAYGSAGERCMAISVIVAVGAETANHLLKKLIPLIKSIRVDAPDAPNTDMGPLISSAHLERVRLAIEHGAQEGAQLMIDGRDFKHPTYPKGFFIGPTLFDNVTKNMSVYQNEIFGPVLVVMRVNSIDEALELVNQNPYGNGTALFTQHGPSAREYCHRVQVGMVGINIPIPVPIANHPFGGWKQSSFGDTFMHGTESIHFYTKLKTITSKWLTSDSLANSFAMPTNG